MNYIQLRKLLDGRPFLRPHLDFPRSNEDLFVAGMSCSIQQIWSCREQGLALPVSPLNLPYSLDENPTRIDADISQLHSELSEFHEKAHKAVTELKKQKEQQQQQKKEQQQQQ